MDVNGKASGTYSVAVLLGRRHEELLEVYARHLAEAVQTPDEPARALLLGLGLTDTSVEAFQEITALVESVCVW